MNSKPVLTLDEAQKMLAAARAEAEANNWAVAIAIVDDGGHPLAMLRLDNCAPVSSYIAIEKARTSALGRRETKIYEEMINAGRTAFLSAPVISATLEGGVPLVVDGQVVAAVGVSGVKSDQDAQVARAAISAVISAI
ncbi:heme-binding protein [Nitrincola sp. MINF-07-Sa-05]|uniref:heme-binding protein n=1 Tax=Nitrincola salilacus TaxID=3400273 RepID=UPI003917FDF5